MVIKMNLKEYIHKIKEKLKRIINSKYFEIITVIIFTILIFFAYIFFIKDNARFPYRSNPNYLKLLVAIPIIIILFYQIKLVNNKDIEFFLKIFLYLMFIPIGCVYCGKDYSTLTFFALIIQLPLIIFTTKYLKKIYIIISKKVFKIKSKKITTKLIFYGFIINTFLVFITCLYYNGLPKLTAINLEIIYTVRKIFYLPKIWNYLFIFETQFVTIFMIILFLHKKQYKYAIFFVLIQLIFFLWKGDRITLLSIPLSITTYYIFKYSNIALDRLIPTIFSTIIMLSMVLFKITSIIFGIFVMRLCITPAVLDFVYFDFFSINPNIGIVGTIFNAIFKVDNVYSNIPYQKIISMQYFNKPEMYSSTGLLVEGYARFGWIGVIIIPILLGIVLFFFSKKINNKNRAFLMGISIFPFMSLSEKYLVNSLTFGSLLLLVGILIFFDPSYINIIKLSKNKAKQ